MTDNIAIKVENLSKVYKLYNNPTDRMKEALHWRGKKYHKDFYALNDVSFEVKKGDCFGILGKNGAGKSTLLKILTGVLSNTGGTVKTNGKISALLELGAGFNPEYTGIENIYFQGNLIGYTKEQISAKLQSILDFADIGDFINQPVKMYSSGMFARLAFAVAINVEPDILIVDEALSVGDMFFQAKCMAKMKQLLQNEHVTVLFVSHDISSIKALCKNAVLLDAGKVVALGEASSVAEEYFSNRFKTNKIKTDKKLNQCNNLTTTYDFKNTYNYSVDKFNKTSSFQRIQNNKASFTNVILLDEDEKQIEQVAFGDFVILRCIIKIHEDIHNLVLGFHVRNANGVEILYDDTVLQNSGGLSVVTGEEYVVDWKFKIALQNNNYNVAVVMSIPINLDIADVDMCDFIPIATQFSVSSQDTRIYAATYANSKCVIKKCL